MTDLVNKPILQAQIIAALDEEEACQTLFIQTVRDAAALAGEQVQDVRIDLLENPPSLYGTDLLFDILLSCALSVAASAAVKAIAAVGSKAIMATRAGNAINGLFKQTTLAEAEKVLVGKDPPPPGSKEAEQFWSSAFEKVLEVPKDEVKRYLKPPEKLANISPAPDAWLGGDSANVAVRRAVMNAARLHEMTIRQTLRAYKYQVIFGSVETADLQQLQRTLATIRTMRTKNVPNSNDTDERQLSAFFEACIWIMHARGMDGVWELVSVDKAVAFDKIIQAGNSGQPPRPGQNPLRAFPSHDPRRTQLVPDRPIAKYWIRRFPNPKAPGPPARFKYNYLNITGEESALLNVINWFQAISTQMTDIQHRLDDRGLAPEGLVSAKNGPTPSGN